MKVWQLQMGENYEGAYRTTLHATLKGARVHAEKWMKESTFDDWEWLSEGRIYAAGGCDWIEITPVEVLH